MKHIKLDLYGGRIDCIKFAIKNTIKMFEDKGQQDMTLIYKSMLAEIERQENYSEPGYHCTCPDVSI